MIRELISIGRELGLSKSDAIKGLGLCIIATPLIYTGFMGLWLLLATVANIMGGMR